MKISFSLIIGLFLAIGNYAQTPTPTPQDAKTDDKASQTTTQTYVRPTSKKRFNNYIKEVFGPGTIARTIGVAGITTATNSPREWGKNWEGFGRRAASSFGQTVIRETTIYALDEGLRVDSKFYRSQKRDVGSRVKNALISPFTARNKNGKRVIGVPRIAGTYASSIIAYETWYPNRFNYKDGLRSGTISFGFNAAFNLFREFIWKK